MKKSSRLFLSPPWVGAEERASVAHAFDSGYVAPCGPMVDAFEAALAKLSGRKYAVAVSSGTAALDLAMVELGVDTSWTVFAPTLTFIATVGPAYHRGAKLVFIDSDETGNMDADLLVQALQNEKGTRRLVIGVDLYGRACGIRAVKGVPFVLDAAESVGACAPVGDMAIYSFNGNKIITTSGGGALLTDNKAVANRARKRAQQAREACAWYEHKEVGYNYRMSNISAAIGLAQLQKLPAILNARARLHANYAQVVEVLPPVRHDNHWLTVALMKSKRQRDAVLRALEAANIEARPVWKPLHLQPVFKSCRVYGGAVAEDLFSRGVCLPSGTGLTSAEQSRVITILKEVLA